MANDTLLSVDAVRGRLAISDQSDYNAVILQSLRRTTSEVERLLYGSIARGTMTELFRTTGWRGDPLTPITRLRLSRLPVDTGTAYTAHVAGSVPSVEDANVRLDLRDWDSDSNDYTSIDAARGILSIHDLRLIPSIVRVTYVGGLSVTSGVYQSVPTWLEELALMLVERDVRRSQIIYGDARMSKEETEGLERAINGHLTRHGRFGSSYVDPFERVAA